MPTDRVPPDFAAFTRWLAAQDPQAPPTAEPNDRLRAAARLARDETLRILATPAARTPRDDHAGPTIEVLALLAAASAETGSPPPELVTPRGFRVALVFDGGDSTERASICVLVRCPPELIAQIEGHTAYLWSGNTRFELGQFDADGKAIGTLPAEIEITLDDFSGGRIRLEAPGTPEPT